MADPILTFGGWDYDRVRPVMDGSVKVEGFQIVPVRLRGEQLFPRSLQRQEFDITELSVSSYIMQVGRKESPFIAIPAFVSRAFRHRSVYVRRDSGITVPKDLEGKRVGVPEYQTTIALWMRGTLQDMYDTDFKTFRFRTGGVNRAGRKERLPLAVPDHMDVEPAPPEKSLSDLLASGELDALISPQPPVCFGNGQGQVVRLWPEYAAEERAYHGRTGFFPIMHFIAIRKEVVEKHPRLPSSLFAALIKAKAIAMKRLQEIADNPANDLTLPWFSESLESAKALMGGNYWPYGVTPNRMELETMCRYSHEQYLSPRPLTPEDLFAPETLEMVDGPTP